MSRKVIGVSLNDLQEDALKVMMKDDLNTNMSAFIGNLIGQEQKRRLEIKNKRTAGRPKKDEEDEMPDEDAPRDIKLPAHLASFVLLKDREKPVNEYDIVLLEDRKKRFDDQNQ